MKEGRPRRYDAPVDRDRFGAHAGQMARLDEAAARCRDLVDDLDENALHFLPQGGENHVAFLCMHMAWAEQRWITAVAEPDFATDPVIRPAPETVGRYERPFVLGAIRDVRARITEPFVAALHRGETTFVPVPQFDDLAGLLDHLHWHWVYHTGQVGLLRRLAGAGYRWRFEER